MADVKDGSYFLYIFLSVTNLCIAHKLRQRVRMENLNANGYKNNNAMQHAAAAAG